MKFQCTSCEACHCIVATQHKNLTIIYSELLSFDVIMISYSVIPNIRIRGITRLRVITRVNNNVKIFHLYYKTWMSYIDITDIKHDH